MEQCPKSELGSIKAHCLTNPILPVLQDLGAMVSIENSHLNADSLPRFSMAWPTVLSCVILKKTLTAKD